jgi:hypothetical protein
MREIYTKFHQPRRNVTFIDELTFLAAERKAPLPTWGSFGEIIMDKETSSRVSHIAGVIMNATADGKETPEDFARLLHDAKRLAGSALSQDQTPGQRKPPVNNEELGGIHPAPTEFSDAQIALDPILHFFHYAHLPEKLRATSRLFFILAATLVNTLPRNAERSVALRKLLEAKDAAVRANLPAPGFGAVASKRMDVERAPGEAVEIGGHDEDRDGPVPFDG